MIASFPWYDLPSVRWANDAIWRATGFPGDLDRMTPLEEQWRSEELLVSQACGLDLFLSGAQIQPVTAPVFDLDCEPGHYFSYFVGSPSGRTGAVNSLSSRSGWLALLEVCDPTEIVLTGSHTASLDALRSGQADCACIDAVTWKILERDDPESISGVEIIDRTSSAPAPPYVAREQNRERVVSGLRKALEDPRTSRAMDALIMDGCVAVDLACYETIRDEFSRVEERVVRLTPSAQ